MADYKYGRKRNLSDPKSSFDNPPHSRLFIICSKQINEEDIRNAFSVFGEIEELWIVKDRTTGDHKGVAYVKYAKTSEAAAAVESMNGKILGNDSRQLKVMIAASRDQGSKRDINEEEKLKRLFVVVAKTMTNEELYDVFKVFGEIEYAAIVKDKENHQNKGFAYVKYIKFSHAAAAFEQCDRKYRAVFAEPRKPRQPLENSERHSNNYRREPPQGIILPDMDNDGFTSLNVISSPMLNQDQVWKLFDIIPGMDYCHSRLEGTPRPDHLISTVVYNSPNAASYALEKLHGFEYPAGNRLIVKPEYNLRNYGDHRGRERFNERAMEREHPNRGGSRTADLAQLAETIAQATNIIQAAGYSASEFLPSGKYGFDMQKKLRCSVSLPEPKPILDSDTEMEARCFIVCTQEALPSSILRDAFCRFGSLIDVYLLPNRNCGYAKYATRQSAENAIKVLNGAEVCGVRLKVMEAEEPGSRKRMRFDEDN